jgi:plastocyanin
LTDEGQGKRRRRGRRRGRQEAHRPEDAAGQEDLAADAADEEITSEADIPGVTGEQPRVPGTGRSGKRERTRTGAGGGSDVSPMDFWRSSRVRSARQQRPGADKQKNLWARITGMYLPPWVPVVGIIVLVFGILGLLFVTRSATGAPRIGEDHWHANYTYYVCGEKQPPAPTWEGTGVHTHGDGLIHIHPFTQREEGAGARLSRWFDYGGGKLDGDEVRMPGSSQVHKNGDECPDGTVGEVQVFVFGARLDDYTRYIPKDGDRVRIVFGPSEEQVQLDDRIVLPEEGATREVEVTVDQPGGEESTVFTPASIAIDAGETVKIILHNVDEVSHGMRIRGVDEQYGTNDDFVVVPEGSDPTQADLGDILQPESDGFVIVRFDAAQNIEFYDPTVQTSTGTIIVSESGAASETPGPDEEVDDEYDIAMVDSLYEPDHFGTDAGDKVRFNLTNDGEFVHNLRIAGPDGEYDTDDDIVSEDVQPGEESDMVFTIDEPGSYEFQCDFHPETQTGTLTVR